MPRPQASTPPAFVLPVSPAARRAITGALLVGTLLASMEVMVVGPAMPKVVEDLGSAGLYPWVFTAYIAAQTVTIPVYGWLADRVGRRDSYLLSVVLFVGGSLLCALAPTMPTVVLGRAVQGLGAGGLIPLTVTVFGDLYPVQARTRMQGIFSLIWGISSLLGPLAGGALTLALGWRAIFWVNVVPGGLAAAVILRSLPRRLGRGPHGAHAKRRALSLLQDPTVQAVLSSGLLLGVVLLGVVGYLPLQVQAVEGGSPLDAGLALMPMSLSWTLAANLAGRGVQRFGFRGLTRAGTAAIALGAIVCALWPVTAAGLLLIGFGMGLTISVYNVAIQEAAPAQLRGTATAWSLFTRSIGSALAVPAFAALAGIDSSAHSFAQIPQLAQGMGRVFWALAVCAVIAALLAWLRFPLSRTGQTPD